MTVAGAGHDRDAVAYDELLTTLADYAAEDWVDQRDEVRTATGLSPASTAELVLLDSLACAFLAVGQPGCARLLDASAAGAEVRDGVVVPGTDQRLDPVGAAFGIGSAIRWLDFNDTWLAAEWGHPSDNLGAILACAAWRDLLVDDVLTACIQAHELQGVLALENSFNAVGLDHVILVRVASAAVATRLLGGTRDQIRDAVSQAFADGGTLRAYRQFPDAGPRKSWAAGDATSRGVRLALLTLAGERGYPRVLSAPTWGFEDVAMHGRQLVLARELGTYVMDNILFKISHPAEFHAQTALEAAIALHPEVAARLDDIERIELSTQASAIRIISKPPEAPLRDFADRDHCLEYIVAVGLLKGGLTAEDYSDEAAADPRIDRLRSRMVVTENEQWSRDYLDPAKRSIANGVRVVFRDGSRTRHEVVEYPIGHASRRAEGIPLLRAKYEHAVSGLFSGRRVEELAALAADTSWLRSMKVRDLLELTATGRSSVTG